MRSLLLVGTLVLPAGCAHNSAGVDTSDAGIAARFKAELKKRPDLSVEYLDTDTHNGVLTISGIVGTEDVRIELVRIARELRGVRQVVANILIRQ